ncbi:MAG: TSUP family transporter [Bacteroidota bacterium]
MNEIIILLIIGLMAGAASGVLGIGGGIIIIPALVSLLSFSQLKAQGTSMGLLLPPIGIFAAINYYKSGNMDIKASLIMCTTFIIGSYLSSKYIVTIPEAVMKKIFAVFLLVYAMKLFFGK